MANASADIYRQMDDEYGDKMEHLFGPGLMSWPEDCDSSRLYMFSSNLKQTLTLTDPEVPHIMAGYENVFGKYNHAFKWLDGLWEVKDIIPKFHTKDVYMMVLYNAETDTYDMVEKQEAENLTEKFGYSYKTDTMDSLNVGDYIGNTALYKSTSYDEHMNYRMGRNANVTYITDNATIEDAIKVRKGWADKVITVEVDEVKVHVNSNDILLNLFGDKDHYQAFPEIGDMVKDCTVCGVRRVNLSHVLYDFQENNLSTIMDTDTEYVAPKNSRIYDIDIYYNGDEDFPDNVFYSQLKKYYDMECEYATRVVDWARKIKASGSKYSPQVSYYLARFKHYNDRDYKWKNNDKAFANLIIIFHTKADVSLQEGFKLTGRYGDKGIISNITDCDAPNSPNRNTAEAMAKQVVESALEGIDLSEEDKNKMRSNVVVVEDCDMPYLDDGTVVDIELNSSGAIRRLAKKHQLTLNHENCWKLSL